MSTEMKLVTAYIHPLLEARVVRALHDLPEFPGFSMVEVRGQGRGKGAGGTYLASESDLVYQRHLQVQIVCAADAVEVISRIVADAGWTGRKGDGVIIVTPVESFSRIREAGARAAQEASR
ncbi:MAG: transcriptional regulator [Rhizobiales bacterium 32-66-8]|jgi:nitrogen regulatory protein PII|nr:MAG: transcriptional regulator [Rhizobiales bacterium 32-66-8]